MWKSRHGEPERRPGSAPWQERIRKTLPSMSSVARVRLAFEYGPK